MHFIKATKLIITTRKKLLEKKLWELYLVDRHNMDKDTFVTFEEYKKKHEEYSKAKLRTPEEKEKFMKEAMLKAENAIKVLDKNNDFHLIGKKKNIRELIYILKQIINKKGV